MLRSRTAAHCLLSVILAGILLGTSIVTGQPKNKGPIAPGGPKKADPKKKRVKDLRIQGHGTVSSGDSVSIAANPITAEADTGLHPCLGVHASKVWFSNYRSASPNIPSLPPCSLVPVTSSTGTTTRTWTSGALNAKIEANPSAPNNTLVVWAYYEDTTGPDTEYSYQRRVVSYKGIPQKLFTGIKVGNVELTRDVSLKEEQYIPLTVGTLKRKGVHASRVYALILPNQHSPRKYHDLGTVKALALRAQETDKTKPDDVKLWKRDKLLLRVGSPLKIPGAMVVAARAPGLAHNTLVLWASYRVGGKDLIEQTYVHFDASTTGGKKVMHLPPLADGSVPGFVQLNPRLESKERD